MAYQIICVLQVVAVLLALWTIRLYRRRPRPYIATPSLASVCTGGLAVAVECAAILLWMLASADWR